MIFALSLLSFVAYIALFIHGRNNFRRLIPDIFAVRRFITLVVLTASIGSVACLPIDDKSDIVNLDICDVDLALGSEQFRPSQEFILPGVRSEHWFSMDVVGDLSACHWIQTFVDTFVPEVSSWFDGDTSLMFGTNFLSAIGVPALKTTTDAFQRKYTFSTRGQALITAI